VWDIVAFLGWGGKHGMGVLLAIARDQMGDSSRNQISLLARKTSSVAAFMTGVAASQLAIDVVTINHDHQHEESQ
jgi:hypothetical protein